MSNLERMISIILMMSATMMTRFIPLIMFKKELSAKTKRIANQLPYATMGLLVVYALKDSFTVETSYGLYQMIGLFAIAIIHKITDHILMSIGGGLMIYLLILNIL
jgi:branched-subunit amino acid transport protein AzlD